MSQTEEQDDILRLVIAGFIVGFIFLGFLYLAYSNDTKDKELCSFLNKTKTYAIYGGRPIEPGFALCCWQEYNQSHLGTEECKAVKVR